MNSDWLMTSLDVGPTTIEIIELLLYRLRRAMARGREVVLTEPPYQDKGKWRATGRIDGEQEHWEFRPGGGAWEPDERTRARWNEQRLREIERDAG